jgi:hypothetical protein
MENPFLRKEETSSQGAVFGEGRSGLRVKGMLKPLTVKDGVMGDNSSGLVELHALVRGT